MAFMISTYRIYLSQIDTGFFLFPFFEILIPFGRRLYEAYFETTISSMFISWTIDNPTEFHPKYILKAIRFVELSSSFNKYSTWSDSKSIREKIDCF